MIVKIWGNIYGDPHKVTTIIAYERSYVIRIDGEDYRWYVKDITEAENAVAEIVERVNKFICPGTDDLLK